MPASHPPLQLEDYVALASFRYAMRKFLRFSKEFLMAEANLTPEQYEALLAVKSFASDNGMLVGQLSERLQVRHHSAVSLTNKLASRNLVTKQRNSKDRRQVSVQLTRAGTDLLESLALVHRNHLRRQSAEIIAAVSRLQKES